MLYFGYVYLRKVKIMKRKKVEIKVQKKIKALPFKKGLNNTYNKSAFARCKLNLKYNVSKIVRAITNVLKATSVNKTKGDKTANFLRAEIKERIIKKGRLIIETVRIS